MELNYRFCIQELSSEVEEIQSRYRLAIALAADADTDFVPAHRSAFAQQLELKESHSSEAEVEYELASLREWLRGRSLF